MDNKLSQFHGSREYLALEKRDREFLEQICRNWQFSVQQIRQIIRISRDLETWDEGSLEEHWGVPESLKPGDRGEKEKRFKSLTLSWQKLKDVPKDYSNFSPGKIVNPVPGFQAILDERQILGDCPVASEKTRCCNLKTLDAVINCGFDCSYCSIQSFYSENKILFHSDLKEKLAKLNLDPGKTWHIGTGQSSDSLMWGNRDGLLEDLCRFAWKNPHVILELKTKSDNVKELLELDVPPNMLLTWSLNTPPLIAAEERLTASLEKRLEAARMVADRGIAVGFHLHPMVWYKGWESDYEALTREMTRQFKAEEVLCVSLGTLTFIKPVLKQLRERPILSKILQMPLEEAAGKWSYPLKIKEELFKAAATGLKEWREDVFFYMCMEDPQLWQPVFGRAYTDNAEFEKDMLYNYQKKISAIQNRRK
ncbi:radical SAM protein [Oceanispirochaeta sp.]|jgi:spore photoproduct lyase|uniref:SPL family radical SAM protein n=1 Tax=Oceanispirochaeta sp. TaxID=2035350 RepID=UPI002626CBEC|nr:radical SAM protein [Oceanispirochaeta sp.]MDA3955961.1 radical SAM protein [Oceanispirochaeta sp.]